MLSCLKAWFLARRPAEARSAALPIGSLVSFAAANEIGDRFLDLLSRLGIAPATGSRIEDELLSLTQLIEVTKNPGIAAESNTVGNLRTAAGIHDLAAKVLSIDGLDESPKLEPHLRQGFNCSRRARTW